MKILTDTELRAHWFRTHEKIYMTDADTMITPAAKDFLREHHIELVTPDAPYGRMPMTPVPKGSDNRPEYVIAMTGQKIHEKPEHMTHLRGNLLVPKTHPCIAFRGKVDSLEARIMETQSFFVSEGREDLSCLLEEILQFTRHILGCEVTGKPVDDIKLLGLDSSQIRHMSHHVQENFGIPHPVPDYKMGKICVALNRLRTIVRETELQAVHAFGSTGSQGPDTRQDIIEALNRLSSCIYILFCGELTGKRPYLKAAADTGCPLSGTCAPDDRPHPETADAATLPEVTTGCRQKGIMVEASGRHVHLTKEAIKLLFGKETLTRKSDLSQPGQYAAQERVRLVTAKGELDNVAVLGPPRSEVQVEMSLTDARILGIDVPVNLSGNLKNAADVIIEGPKGIYNAVGSAIVSKAHIHMTPADAAYYHVSDGDSVSVDLVTKRPVTIHDVMIRVNENFALAMHLDYDEANACQYKKGDLGYIRH